MQKKTLKRFTSQNIKQATEYWVSMIEQKEDLSPGMQPVFDKTTVKFFHWLWEDKKYQQFMYDRDQLSTEKPRYEFIFFNFKPIYNMYNNFFDNNMELFDWREENRRNYTEFIASLRKISLVADRPKLLKLPLIYFYAYLNKEEKDPFWGANREVIDSMDKFIKKDFFLKRCWIILWDTVKKIYITFDNSDSSKLINLFKTSAEKAFIREEIPKDIWGLREDIKAKYDKSRLPVRRKKYEEYKKNKPKKYWELGLVDDL